MKKTILCIRTADFEDPHVEEVGKHIKALDSEVQLVTFVPLQDGHFIEITTGHVFEPDPTCLFVVDGKRIPAKSITSVWYRWLPKSVSAAKDLQGYIAKEFAFKEWEKVIRSLESYLSHARWLNPLAASDLTDCKPYQLRLAQEVGLTVPSTTITNNPVAVEKLFDRVENRRVIFKTMEKCFIPPDIMLYTTEITTKFPSMSRTDIAQCPAIYQELVERRSDLRITVVGREVFVARIASQMLEEEKDRLDWRRCQDRDELYTEVQIPESLKERLLEFQKRAGLAFAAYDFLECGDDFIFLECNGNLAAWLWLERRLGFNVSEHVARYLLGRDDTDNS